MGIDAEKIWESLRTKGLRFVIVTIVSTLSFSIINKLAENSISNGVDKIWALVSPPRFLILFSEPVDFSRFSLLADGERPHRQIQLHAKGDRAVEVVVAPGYYLAVLDRNGPSGKIVLKEPLNLRPNGSEIRIDASPTRWALESATRKFGDHSIAGPATLIGTRWTSTQADWDIARSAGNDTISAVLHAALGQVGVNEGGDEADRNAIAAYWAAIHRPDLPKGTPWGGAFLGWVLHQAGVMPPSQPASFLNWQNWGKSIPIDRVSPGTVGVFDFPGLPQAPSRLLVGIVLRRKAECTEIIVGNIADRVVITCVGVPLKAVRGISI